MTSPPRSLVLRPAYLVLAALLVSAVAAPPRSAQAARVEVTDDVYFDLHYLLQTWAQVSNDPEADEAVIGPEFRIRRSRLVIRGQVAPNAGFFFGAGYDTDVGRFQVWDAAAWLELDRALVVDAGQVMVPFVRHAQQFSVHLHTVEFLNTAFRYPPDATISRRAPGVRARGLLLGDRIDYRIAATTGAPTDTRRPRVTGRLGWNVLDPEPGYVLPGTYWGDERVVMPAVAVDVQPDVLEESGAYRAAGAELFWSLPVGAHRATGQAAFLYYRGLPDDDGAMVDRHAIGAILDAGYAFGAVEPVVAAEWLRPRGAGTFEAQRFAAHLGLNWWARGTTLNLKTDLGLVKEPGRGLDEAARVLTVQAQARLP